MPIQLSSCNATMLRRLLAGELSKHEQATVERHLDDCGRCCEMIQSFAADDDWWRDPLQVNEVLPSDLYRLRRTFLPDR